jgi:hypothetical protein
MQFVHSIKGNVVKLSLSKFVIKEVLKLTELTDKKVIYYLIQITNKWFTFILLVLHLILVYK